MWLNYNEGSLLFQVTKTKRVIPRNSKDILSYSSDKREWGLNGEPVVRTKPVTLPPHSLSHGQDSDVDLRREWRRTGKRGTVSVSFTYRTSVVSLPMSCFSRVTECLDTRTRFTSKEIRWLYRLSVCVCPNDVHTSKVGLKTFWFLKDIFYP